jgi:predicted DCC family thiol-disulfide oxidoreductase YuxK
MMTIPAISKPDKPMLLFDGTCKVCRRLAHWVQNSAQKASQPTLIVQPVGDDPQRLRALNPGLDIWQAYKTVHVLMPDGPMKLGGEAIAEVLRRLPDTAWFARIFALRLFGHRPFQALLDEAYVILESVRPLLGCESCGTPNVWVGKIEWLMNRSKAILGGRRHHGPASRATPRHATRQPRLARH